VDSAPATCPFPGEEERGSRVTEETILRFKEMEQLRLLSECGGAGPVFREPVATTIGAERDRSVSVFSTVLGWI
jgi:hypothetical protein